MCGGRGGGRGRDLDPGAVPLLVHAVPGGGVRGGGGGGHGLHPAPPLRLAAEAEQHLHGALLLVLQQCQPQRVAGGVATDCLSILPAPDTAPQGATWQQHQLYAGSAPPAFLQ